MENLAKVYTTEVTNPLAWPLHATADDLMGFPPCVVSVNECDPLRDEGKAFVRKLAAAGRRVAGKIVLGTMHGGDAFLGTLACEDTIHSIAAFAKSLKALTPLKGVLTSGLNPMKSG